MSEGKAEPLSLESQLWRVLQLNGTDYLIKGLFKDDGYHVMLSDLSSIWEEELDSDDILQRSKVLNRHIEAPLSVLTKQLMTHFCSNESDSSYTLPTSTHHHPHSLTLTLTTTLASLPFQWEFNMKSAPSDSLSVHLVSPLLAMVGELSHRQGELVKLLANKDREIQDYKDQGSEVSRKYLETSPFNEKQFSSRMTSSSAFTVRANHSLSLFDHSSSQHLYRDVSTAQLLASNSDGMLDEISDQAIGSTHTSPSKSPLKRPPPVDSPSKEDEVTRRKELERKLEDGKQKPKKKKRKLM